MDRPPTSYGGYGGNDPNELPKYQFDYPKTWQSVVPNKVEKGTQGIDCRIIDPKNKGHRIFVITLGRAGEDRASFQLRSVAAWMRGKRGATCCRSGVGGARTRAVKLGTSIQEAKVRESATHRISQRHAWVEGPSTSCLPALRSSPCLCHT